MYVSPAFRSYNKKSTYGVGPPKAHVKPTDNFPISREIVKSVGLFLNDVTGQIPPTITIKLLFEDSAGELRLANEGLMKPVLKINKIMYMPYLKYCKYDKGVSPVWLKKRMEFEEDPCDYMYHLPAVPGDIYTAFERSIRTFAEALGTSVNGILDKIDNYNITILVQKNMQAILCIPFMSEIFRDLGVSTEGQDINLKSSQNKMIVRPMNKIIHSGQADEEAGKFSCGRCVKGQQYTVESTHSNTVHFLINQWEKHQ